MGPPAGSWCGSGLPSGPDARRPRRDGRRSRSWGKEYAGYEFNADLYEVDCARNIFKLVETFAHMTKDGKVIGMVKHKEQEGEIPAGRASSTG